MSLEWLYQQDEMRAYSVDTKKGQERLQALTKHLPEILEVARVKPPTQRRVLCLMAGSCIEGLVFASLYGAEVTCLDVQRSLLAKGMRAAKRRRVKLRTAVGDAKELTMHVSGKFDLVTILGSPLPHVNIAEFDEIIGQVRRVLASRGVLLIDQSDLVFRVIPQYRDAMVTNLRPPVINVHVAFNPREGYFERLYHSRNRSEVYKIHLWSPWIIEYMLRKNDFSKVNVAPYVSSYTGIQTYLFTAQA